jgi:hypothetical protein
LEIWYISEIVFFTIPSMRRFNLRQCYHRCTVCSLFTIESKVTLVYTDWNRILRKDNRGCQSPNIKSWCCSILDILFHVQLCRWLFFRPHVDFWS